MSSFQRKMERAKAKKEGTLPHKKVLAKKFGCSVSQLNKRLKRREENLKKLEDNDYGKE